MAHKMPPSVVLVVFCALTVAMATAAPLSNQETFVETSQNGVSVDRAKRAQEEITFGNQQNKPRVVAKKSDPSDAVVPALPVVDVIDKSGKILVHSEQPVPPAMASRIEAAMESNKDEQKLKDSMMDALQQVVPQTSAAEDVKQEIKAEQPKEVPVAKVDVPTTVPEEAAAEGQEDDVDQFLHDMQDKDADNGLDLNTSSNQEDSVSADLYPVLYLNSPLKGGKFWRSFYPYRNKRALRSARRFSPTYARRGPRRTKRDSLSDFYGAYVNEDPRSEADELSSLTPEEKEYVYRQLVDNLVNLYQENQPDEEETPLELPYTQEASDGPYIPYEVYGEEGPYLGRYEYEPSSPVMAKRGMVDYYPLEEVQKRYFFPFSDEPDTHWGAFVPEKRDYNEAILRLQRLALALDDSPRSYYQELQEEYRKK